MNIKLFYQVWSDGDDDKGSAVHTIINIGIF